MRKIYVVIKYSGFNHEQTYVAVLDAFWNKEEAEKYIEEYKNTVEYREESKECDYCEMVIEESQIEN